MTTAKKNLSIVLLIVMTVTLFSFDLPIGWFKTGNALESYDIGIDKGAGQDGKNAATIKCIDKKIDGYGILMQNYLPDNYLGKRVRMSGMVRTKDVEDWCGLWLRIDQKDLKGFLSFDNMHDGKKDRSIRGTNEWKIYEIVLDVPAKATNMAFGALLVGAGQLWFDDIKFEIVDNTVPTTGVGNESPVPYKDPINLDFEKQR